MKKALLSKIENRSAKIGIIGLGYVGLPLALRFCEENFKVTGFDCDPQKVNMLNKGISYIKHIPSLRISSFVSHNKPLFSATDDMSRLSEVDVIIICVPTPLTDKREPDMQYVVGTTPVRVLAGTASLLTRFTLPGRHGNTMQPQGL